MNYHYKLLIIKTINHGLLTMDNQLLTITYFPMLFDLDEHQLGGWAVAF